MAKTKPNKPIKPPKPTKVEKKVKLKKIGKRRGLNDQQADELITLLDADDPVEALVEWHNKKAIAE